MSFIRSHLRAWGLVCVLSALLSACGTVKPLYRPQTRGSLDDAQPLDGLELTIRPDRDAVRLGEVLVFEARLRNVGDRPLRIPAHPDLIFLWTYPNGERDNFIIECEDHRSFEADELIDLRPGAVLRKRYPIKTYYFDYMGITEFRAFCDVPRNDNAGVDPVWTGRVYSNGYGIEVYEKRPRWAGNDRRSVD